MNEVCEMLYMIRVSVTKHTDLGLFDNVVGLQLDGEFHPKF